MWQNGDDCCYNWNEAKSYCQNLNWGEYRDWRLATIDELRSLIRGSLKTETGGECGVTEACLESGCWNEACKGGTYLLGPGSAGRYLSAKLVGDGYLIVSSSEIGVSIEFEIWLVDFGSGAVIRGYYEDYGYSVRCVRNVD